jgi:methylase of polypeptide subunit release factors
VGQIGLLAVALEPRDLVMVDANPRACDLARRNVDEARLASRVDIRNARLETALLPGERFVGVIADPPWVPRDDVGRYPEDPTTAIDGGPEGLDVARACIEVAAAHLEPGGWLLLQLGNADQAEVLADWAGPLGVQWVETREFERGVLVHLVRR